MLTRHPQLTVILLSAATLLMCACGKPKARVEPPKPPPQAGTERARPGAAPGPGAAREPGVDKAVGATPDSALGPWIRIGLVTDAAEVVIASGGEYYLMENVPEAERKAVRGSVRIRFERGPGTGPAGPCHRVQVLSSRSRESAERIRAELEKALGVPAVLRENSDATSHRVRVGEFETRDEAARLRDTLAGNGYPDAFIVEDARPGGTGRPALALRGEDGLFMVGGSGFLFLPPSGSGFLTLDGKAYRGLLDVRPGGNNRVTVVNRLRMEEYLPGVVPAEMSPATYPEFDALAAQSIAARTYALRHMGRYESQGFDLTNDTRTQVYGGVAAEREATDEAVRRTAGLAVYYDGELIDAMYTSTCGGRTEDFANVYGGPPVPYLVSVACAVDGGAADGATIPGRHSLNAPVYADDGSLANRDLELARVLGIAGAPLSAADLDGPLDGGEAAGLIGRAQRIIDPRGGPPGGPPGGASPVTRIAFLQSAAEHLFGPDEIRRRISPADAAYYSGNLADGPEVPETARPALAFLMQKNLWRPFPDNTARPHDPIRRGEALLLVLRWAESQKPDVLRQGVFSAAAAEPSGASAAEIEIRWGHSARTFRLAPNLAVFRSEAGRRIPVEAVRVIGNEKAAFHVDQDGAIDFLEVELNPSGAASDRYSPVATWEATLARKDAGEKLRALAGDIGELEDIEPARLGNSGRVVEVRVVGSRSSAVVNGYRLRGALGLRDTLYTIERQKTPDGAVASFTFHGRGYGHGVGLCQVGAYGMAKAGKSYREILETYYRGVEIKKAY